MNWKTEIDELFKLATLHSWCSQVNKLIIEFNSNYKNNNSIVDYLVSILKEKNLPGEYYILSLVLLNYQEYPVKDIIELAITALYSKLNKNDILFFKEHLFSGSFPLSSDLSEDITNRSFLSPKVAIKKAMEIDSVISKNNPIITVLYMNFILSRMDMNEENRAMVAFLLLRVDVELPKSLNERVYKYLIEYKDIIQELLQEENGESIILDDIYSIKENITKIEIIQNKNITEEQYVTERKSASDKENIFESVKPEKFKLQKIREPGMSISEYSTIKTNKKTLFSKEKKSPKKDKSYLTDKIKITDKPDLDEILSLKREKIYKNKNLKDDIEGKSRSKKTKNRSIEETDIRKQKKSDEKELSAVKSNLIRNNKESSDISKKSKPVKKTDIVKKSWTIGLKKNKQILESILAGVEKIKHHNILSAKKVKFDKNTIVNRKKIVPEKRIVLKYISISAVIFALVTIIALKLITTVDRESVSPVLNESDSLIQKNNSVESESLTVNAAVAAETDEVDGDLDYKVSDRGKQIIQEDFPVNITIINNKIIWKVIEGESITGLFFALQEYRQDFINTDLEKISNTNWETFFRIFKNNNPVRDSYHIIYPEEIFELPLH